MQIYSGILPSGSRMWSLEQSFVLGIHILGHILSGVNQFNLNQFNGTMPVYTSLWSGLSFSGQHAPNVHLPVVITFITVIILAYKRGSTSVALCTNFWQILTSPWRPQQIAAGFKSLTRIKHSEL